MIVDRLTALASSAVRGGLATAGVAHRIGLTQPVRPDRLVGMAAVFAAAGRAPITAVLIVFELTGDYSIILPLMLAVVVATGLSKLLSEDSIYTLKLRRRGIDMGWSFDSRADLEAVVRIELPTKVAEEVLATHTGTTVDYAVNLWWRHY